MKIQFFILFLIAMMGLPACTSASKSSDSGVQHQKTWSDSIDASIRARRDDYRACFEREANSVHHLRGKVVLAFTISANGQALNPKIDSTTLNNRAVEGCILNLIARTQFEKPADGKAAEIKYPMEFEAKN